MSRASLCCLARPGTTACSWSIQWHPWVGPPSTWTSKVSHVPVPLLLGSRSLQAPLCPQACRQPTLWVRAPGKLHLLPLHQLINTPLFPLGCQAPMWGASGREKPLQHLERCSEPLKCVWEKCQSACQPGWASVSPSAGTPPVRHVQLALFAEKPSRPSISPQRKVLIHMGGACLRPPTQLGQPQFSQNHLHQGAPGRQGRDFWADPQIAALQGGAQEGGPGDAVQVAGLSGMPTLCPPGRPAHRRREDAPAQVPREAGVNLGHPPYFCPNPPAHPQQRLRTSVSGRQALVMSFGMSVL